MASVREQVEGRVRAAWVNGGPLAATPRGSDRYVVTGRDGHARYTVQVLSPESATCDCPAGLHGRFCWHAAAALLRRLADDQPLAVASKNRDNVISLENRRRERVTATPAPASLAAVLDRATVRADRLERLVKLARAMGPAR